MKAWRLLEEARDAAALVEAGSKARLQLGLHSLATRLQAVLDKGACETAKISVPDPGFHALVDSLRQSGLPPETVWFLRCALIARGAAKAMAVSAEAQRLTRAMRALQTACAAFASAFAERAPDDGLACVRPDAPLASPAAAYQDASHPSTEPPRHMDEQGANSASPAAPRLPAALMTAPSSGPAAAATEEADAMAATDMMADPSRLGHPLVSAWVAARKHACTLRGLDSALSIIVRWLHEITEGNADARVLFVGSDSDVTRSTTSFVPRGFELGSALEAPRAVAHAHSEAMVAQLAKYGWPRWIVEAAGHSQRTLQACSLCGFRHSPHWVRDRVCLGCEHRIRAAGGCPFGARKGARCGADAWCPHEQRCFVCDKVSCARCRFFQGDGSDVADVVASLQPAALFVDFDRTLCSTKGGSPLQGKHSIDEELAGLCHQLEGRVHVVTRNAHADDIATFLRSHGLPSVPVHRVKKPTSKAEVVLSPHLTVGTSASATPADEASPTTLPPKVVLFVDDTLAELLDPPIRESEMIVRFLFVRAGA